MRSPLAPAALLCLILTLPARAQPDLSADHLAGTEPLVMNEPLDVVMVRGINYFAEREIADSPNRRPAKWNRDYSSVEAYEQSVEPNRERLREIIGAVDPLEKNYTFGDSTIPGPIDWFVDDGFFSMTTSWLSNEGITGEAVAFEHESWHDARHRAIVVLLPDADWTPDDLYGNTSRLPLNQQFVRHLAKNKCAVYVPYLINRDDTFSGKPDIRFTNQPHREFIYRMAFEMGRHVIGYEVQKIIALLDQLEEIRDLFEEEVRREKIPIAIVGVGEGALLAMHVAALDQRVDAVMVSGYFQQRENVWLEPIYRNVWNSMTEFGDADLASLIAPTPLVIEAASPPLVDGPPAAAAGRSSGAAPGRITTPSIESVRAEYDEAKSHYEQLDRADNIQLVLSDDGVGPPGSFEALSTFIKTLGIDGFVPCEGPENIFEDETEDNEWLEEHLQEIAERSALRQKRQVAELDRFTQALMHRSDKERYKFWANVDLSSVEACVESLEFYRDYVYDNMIGRLPEPEMPLNPRTRKVIDEPTHVGYEVVLDCYPAGDTERPIPEGADTSIPDTGSVDEIGWAVGEDWGVIAGGILLLPKDLKEGEQRPVVVCQHGLEGRPIDTITTDQSDRAWGPYKGFSTALVERGFIVYAPQNPYRGHDAFRVIQRKSNPMGRSLFSYIIPQHGRTLEWLASLPYVDRDRIGFYGLSYGGKTAVRVPPMLVPSEDKAGYCLSICSADYNEWVRKNASSEDRYSYVFTGEYEIFEWNMGHVANYAELSYLMTPRPFMVERGHDDGVAPDEWVAWEYAKVRRHYTKLGISERTEIEFFDGPHTINGVGTYGFLHRHLDWPKPQ